MSVPSIKGICVANAWSEVNLLIDQEMVSREELILRLNADALTIVDTKIEADLWYPVAAIEQLEAIVVEFRAGGDLRYLAEVGHRGFARLLERDGFARFMRAAAARGRQAGPTLVCLSALLFNFGDWRFSGDLDAFTVEGRDAAALGEIVGWLAAGYLSAAVSFLTGAPCPVRQDRSDPARVCFVGGAARA